MSVRMFLALALTAVATVATAAPAIGGAEWPETFRVVGIAPGHSLALRSGPGLVYPIAGALPANVAGVRNLGCKGGLTTAEWTRASAHERAASAERRWCHVRFGTVAGWARARFLREDSARAEPLGRP